MRSHALTQDALTPCFFSKYVVAHDSPCDGLALRTSEPTAHAIWIASAIYCAKSPIVSLF